MVIMKMMIKLQKSVEAQSTTSCRAQDGGAHCGAAVGGKGMVSKAKLVVYGFGV